MSKKIVSKVKKPHQKCSHRSSSVGNDSCVRGEEDEDFDYPSLLRHPDDLNFGYNTNNYSPDNLEHQLRRLEMINDNLHRHLKRIQISGTTMNDYHQCGDLDWREPTYLATGASNDTEQCNGAHCHRFRCEHYKLDKFDNKNSNLASGRCNLLQNPPKAYNEFLYDVNDHGVSQPVTVAHPKFPTSSLTYFATPYLKKSTNIVQNDRVSNSSDTSRQSSSSSQHLRIGIDIFNRNPPAGVDYFQQNCFVDSDDDLVDLFIRKKGFSKMMLYEYLINKNNKDVHKCFTRHLDLRLKTIPEAIKEYMKYSFITGEYSTMLLIVELLSDAYMTQHPDGVMGLTRDQLTTIMQFLLTFHANEAREKRPSHRLNRERFVDLLQRSLGGQDERHRISRQLASCLYLEVTESPLQSTPDDKLQTLLTIQRQMCELPRDFSLPQQHRYIICHVDLCLVQFPSSTSAPLSTAPTPHSNHDKPSLRDRTLFLFNDLLIITKKHWTTNSKQPYKVKQMLSLTHLQTSLSTRCSAQAVPIPGSMKVVQISHVTTGDLLMTYYSKIERDLLEFHHTLESALNIHKAVIDGLKKADSIDLSPLPTDLH